MKIDQNLCESVFTCVNCAIELCWIVLKTLLYLI